jgi:hypothetical protein
MENKELIQSINRLAGVLEENLGAINGFLEKISNELDGETSVSIRDALWEIRHKPSNF